MIRSKLPTPEFLANYDNIDWSDGPPAREDGVYGGEHVEPVKTISTIRSDKPHVSTSAAVHADQVSEFNKHAAKGVRYDSQGRMVSESWAARLRELRRRGLTDSWS